MTAIRSAFEMDNGALIKTELPGLKLLSRGKVRDIYELADRLLIVTTDRISAFDHVLPNGIPDKGRVLAGLSEFWFAKTQEIIPNHLVGMCTRRYPAETRNSAELLAGRGMVVRRCQVVPVECVVRGYLSGSGWKEYQNTGSVCGIKLPSGLRESERLPEPIFTPASKASSGHDINVDFDFICREVGLELAEKLRETSLRLYKEAEEYLIKRGIILSDTKFEFGQDEGELFLIDEALTPDSSRFWPQDDFEPGRPQKSYDKQFVRDYLETCGWDKESPPPRLPDDVVAKTREKYLQAYRLITGTEL